MNWGRYISSISFFLSCQQGYMVARYGTGIWLGWGGGRVNIIWKGKSQITISHLSGPTTTVVVILPPRVRWCTVHAHFCFMVVPNSVVDRVDPDPIFYFDADLDPNPDPSWIYTQVGKKFFYSQQWQSTLFYLSHQCHRFHNFQYFGQHIEIFWKKYSLS